MSEKKHSSTQTPERNPFDNIEGKPSAQNSGSPRPIHTRKADTSASARYPGKNASVPRQKHARQNAPSRQKIIYDIPKDPLANPTVFDKILEKSGKALSRLPMKKFAVLGGSAVCVLLIAYVGIAMAYGGQFLPNTYINEIPVGGMTKAEAAEALLSTAEADALVLIKQDGSTAKFDTVGYDAHYSVSDEALDEAFSENRLLWLGKLFRKSSYTIQYDYNYSMDDLREIIASYSWGEAQAAYIEPGTDGNPRIVPATYGDMFDREVLLEYIDSQLAAGNCTITMADSGCYDEFAAEMQAEDLTDKLELCEQLENCTITLDFGDRQEILDGATLKKWIHRIDSTGTSFNRSRIEAYVADLAAKYDTYSKDLEFVSTLDGPITVPWTETSTYGWKIDQSRTVDHIIELLQNAASVTTEPIYSKACDAEGCFCGIGYCRDAKTGDVGNTYIEVDISAQHLWYYRNGKLLMESDCVTGEEGDPSCSTPTPRGIFYIRVHILDAYLMGQHVDYWMPVNHNDIGLHDAIWQSAFGGTRYMNGYGSHGCINLPLQFVSDLYNSTEDGIPVIVHD